MKIPIHRVVFYYNIIKRFIYKNGHKRNPPFLKGDFFRSFTTTFNVLAHGYHL